MRLKTSASREIYAQIEKDSEKHSVQELCEAYEVSRSGYYKWLKRKGQLNRYELWQQQLDAFVLDIHAHYPDQGYRMVNDTLLTQSGLVVSDLSVWRSMRRLGISGFVRRKNENSLPSGNAKQKAARLAYCFYFGCGGGI